MYDALGSKITVVELLDWLIPGADRDIIRPLAQAHRKRYEGIYLEDQGHQNRSGARRAARPRSRATDAPQPQVYDRVLLSVGRRPNGKAIDARSRRRAGERARLHPGGSSSMRTNVPHIYAIGDIVRRAHARAQRPATKASWRRRSSRVTSAAFDARTIPSVAYTDPEVAWMGLTETMARAQGIEIEKAVFPWAASGRARATARDEGSPSCIFDKSTRRLLGAAIVGPNAGELIAETVLALEMGADAEDIGLTIHPHPTLSETVVLRRRDRRRQHHRSVHAQEVGRESRRGRAMGNRVDVLTRSWPWSSAPEALSEAGVLVHLPGQPDPGAARAGTGLDTAGR